MDIREMILSKDQHDFLDLSDELQTFVIDLDLCHDRISVLESLRSEIFSLDVVRKVD